MFAVQGVYTDGAVIINEPVPVPVQEKYDVVVTFLKPAERREFVVEELTGIELKKPDTTSLEEKLAALKKLSGIAAGNTAIQSIKKSPQINTDKKGFVSGNPR